MSSTHAKHLSLASNSDSNIAQLIQKGQRLTEDLQRLGVEHSSMLQGARRTEELLQKLAKDADTDKAERARAILDSTVISSVRINRGDHFIDRPRFSVENRMESGRVYDRRDNKWVKRLVVSPLGGERIIFDRAGCLFRRRVMMDDLRDRNWVQECTKAGVKRKVECDKNDDDVEDKMSEAEDTDEEGEVEEDGDDEDRKVGVQNI